MTNEQQKQANRLAEQLIETNLSPFGREMSVKVAAHLQYIDGFFRDYIDQLHLAVAGIDLETALPVLAGEQWGKLSNSQKRQWIKAVQTAMARTVEHCQAYQRMLTSQTNHIEAVEAQSVINETALIAQADVS